MSLDWVGLSPKRVTEGAKAIALGLVVVAMGCVIGYVAYLLWPSGVLEIPFSQFTILTIVRLLAASFLFVTSGIFLIGGASIILEGCGEFFGGLAFVRFGSSEPPRPPDPEVASPKRLGLILLAILIGTSVAAPVAQVVQLLGFDEFVQTVTMSAAGWIVAGALIWHWTKRPPKWLD